MKGARAQKPKAHLRFSALVYGGVSVGVSSHLSAVSYAPIKSLMAPNTAFGATFEVSAQKAARHQLKLEQQRWQWRRGVSALRETEVSNLFTQHRERETVKVYVALPLADVTAAPLIKSQHN